MVCVDYAFLYTLRYITGWLTGDLADATPLYTVTLSAQLQLQRFCVCAGAPGAARAML
jgi:hypothetical protein